MKPILKALLYSLLVGLVVFALSIVPLIMIEMTGPSGGPDWIEPVFTAFLLLAVVVAFVFFYRREKRVRPDVNER